MFRSNPPGIVLGPHVLQTNQDLAARIDIELRGIARLLSNLGATIVL